MLTSFESFAHEHFVIWSEEKIVTQAANCFLLVGKWEKARGQISRCPCVISFLKLLPRIRILVQTTINNLYNFPAGEEATPPGSWSVVV